MPSYKPYHPEQAELLPSHVKDVLGDNHLCFVVHEVVEKLDIGRFEAAYGEAGGESPYHPRMMLKVWLYAFALKVKSTRKLERRLHEDLGFRFLAGGCAPDFKTLSEFLRVHRAAILEMFTQVLQMLRRAGLARVGEVAIDSTRIKGNASRDRVVQRAVLQKQVKQWMDAVEDDPDRQPGRQVSEGERQRVREQLQQMEQMGEDKMSLTDPEARFLRTRQGYELGYTAELAVSEDHFIVAQRVTQNKTDNASLLPLVEEVERQCRERPQRVLADTGFYANDNVDQLEQRGIDGYVPDSNLASELKGKRRAEDLDRYAVQHAGLQRMRQKLRSAAGRERYQRRKELVEPMIGSLKEHGDMRQFQRRGLVLVGVEFTLAVIALNLKRWHRVRQA
ncbi:MAG TPA: IS1182 family transposase [Terracidiphilus sp.]|jgi:transposase